MIDYQNYYPVSETDIPLLSMEELEYLRRQAITAAALQCRWMIDTGEMAPGTCRCHLVECNYSESEIYRNRSPKPPRWKATLCNPNNCRYFET